MSSYILSILGIVVVGIMLDVILPSGDMAKYIKGIFSIFIIFVLISPLTNLKKLNLNLMKYVNVDNYSSNDKLLENIYDEQINNLTQQIKDDLNTAGFSCVEIEIAYNITNSSITIQKVQVYLDNLILNSSSQHIDKYAYIKQVIVARTNINEGMIIFYE